MKILGFGWAGSGASSFLSYITLTVGEQRVWAEAGIHNNAVAVPFALSSGFPIIAYSAFVLRTAGTCSKRFRLVRAKSHLLCRHSYVGFSRQTRGHVTRRWWTIGFMKITGEQQGTDLHEEIEICRGMRVTARKKTMQNWRRRLLDASSGEEFSLA